MSQSHSTSLPFPIPISAVQPGKRDFAALEEGRRDEKNNFYRRREGSDSQQTSVEAIGILSS